MGVGIVSGHLDRSGRMLVYEGCNNSAISRRRVATGLHESQWNVKSDI